MSRQSLARIAALFYVLNFVLGGLALSWMAKGPTPASDAITIAAAADYAIVVVLLGTPVRAGGTGLVLGCRGGRTDRLRLVGG